MLFFYSAFICQFINVLHRDFKNLIDVYTINVCNVKTWNDFHFHFFLLIQTLYSNVQSKVILIYLQFERNITEDTSSVVCWWCIRTRDNMVQMKVRLSSLWKRNTMVKIPQHVTSVTWLFLWKAVWRNIWKHTIRRGQTNATNVAMHPLGQIVWGDIWKCIVEKRQTNATNVTLHLLKQVI